MVGAGQGIGVAREIEDTPTSITLPYGEHGARTRRIWMGKDPPRTRSAMDRFRGTAEEGVELDFPEIAQSDGTARTHLKDIDGMNGGVLARELEDKFFKMCFGEMIRTRMENIPSSESVPEVSGPRKSMLVVSEFIGCSPSMSGAIRVNPWNTEATAESLNEAISMSEREKQLRHEKHYRYVSTHDVAYWSRSFIQDPERACKDHFRKPCWGIGLGFGIMEGGFAPIFENIRTHMKNIGIMEGGLAQEFEDKFSKMDAQMKSAYLRANVMLLTNALTPITRRSSANSTGDYYLYLDSGASRHMVFDPALLINLRDPPSGTGQFRAADGSLLSVAAYGDIIMENFRIPDVYLVEELTVNLISVGQLASNHKVSSCFSGNECNLMLSGGEQIGGAIRRDDNQYILRFLEIE